MWLRILVVLFLAQTLSGCFVAGTISSVQELGLTDGTRRQLLPKELTSFHHSLYWGRLDEALELARNEERAVLLGSLRSFDEHGRIVESKVVGTDFTPDAYEAEVEVTLKRLNARTNMVTPTTYLERWVFTTSDGWRIASIDHVTGNS